MKIETTSMIEFWQLNVFIEWVRPTKAAVYAFIK